MICLILLLTVFANSCASQFGVESFYAFVLDGFTIVLDEGFTQIEPSESAVYAFESRKMSVYAYEETFEHLEANGYAEIPSLKDYLTMVMHANGVEGERVRENDIWGFAFNSTSGNKTFTHRVYVYQGEESFWTVRFVVFADDYEAAKEAISTYAESVRVE